MTERPDPTAFEAPLMTRQARITRAVPAPAQREGEPSPGGGVIDIVWSTGATVQRVRWEGWDDRIEYDEELIVTPAAVRLDFLNKGAPFLDSHRSWGGIDSVIGSIVPGSAKIAGGEGVAQVRLTSAPGSADMVHKIMEGTIRFVSVGYQVHEYQITKKDGETEIWRAVDWEPLEVSAVAIPADTGATIGGERGTKSDSPERFFPCRVRVEGSTAAPAAFTRGKIMTDKTKPGADAETRTAEEIAAQATKDAEAARAAEAQRAKDAAAGGDKPKDPTAAETRAAALADANVVTELCARHGMEADFGTKMLREGKTVDQIREAILNKLAESDTHVARGGSPNFATVRGEDKKAVEYRDAMENALLHRSDPGRHVLTEAGRQFRGMALLELARDALDQVGVTTRGMSKFEIITGALKGRRLDGSVLPMTRAAGMHTTSDFPYILANVANKTLRAAYESTPRTFQKWARRVVISDFKQVTRAQLGGAPDLLRVPESGEFTYGTMGEAKEVYALLTYGRIIAITRQAIINDDLDAFTRIPQAFGAAAADLESDIVYGTLIANAAMNDTVAIFHATHANLGTAAVIGSASLTEMYRMFAAQRGIEGRQIAIPPKYMLVPPGQRLLEARQQMTQTTPNQTSQVNAYAGQLEIIDEVRLIPSSGQDPWYVMADPSRIDTFEYAYLEGQEGVFTETRNGFEVDGIEIKARHDFASAAIDYRGMWKNAGLAPA